MLYSISLWILKIKFVTFSLNFIMFFVVHYIFLRMFLYKAGYIKYKSINIK